MKEEPPSISAQPEKLGLIQSIKSFFRDFHIRISFKPTNQEELTSVLRDAEENNLIDKGVLDMMEETSNTHVHNICDGPIVTTTICIPTVSCTHTSITT